MSLARHRSRYTDPTCVIAPADPSHRCYRRDGQPLTGDNGDCWPNARLSAAARRPLGDTDDPATAAANACAEATAVQLLHATGRAVEAIRQRRPPRETSDLIHDLEDAAYVASLAMYAAQWDTHLTVTRDVVR